MTAAEPRPQSSAQSAAQASPPGQAKADVLFYVQHLLGIGHLRRTAALAKATAERGLAVLVVSGGRPLADLDLGAARQLQLPPAWVADASFAPLLDQAGAPVGAGWRTARRAALLQAFEAARPKVLVTEQFPFGRGQLRFELEPLLQAAAAARPRPWIVASVRDLLVEKPAERTLWMAETVERYFDRVLVHGDPTLIRFADSFAHAARIGRLLTYTGYVVTAAPSLDVRDPAGGEVGAEEVGSGEVLVSVGGGAFGLPLLEAALAARRLDPLPTAPWRLLVGPNLPEAAFRALAAAAPPATVVERARPDFQTLLARCRASLSQGGYNTVLEVLASGAPAVVAPHASGQESEQTARARLLARRGLIEMVEEAALSPDTLSRALIRAEERGRRAPPEIQTLGSWTAARILAGMAAAPSPRSSLRVERPVR